MAIKFTQKLVLFSNTLNNYVEKYHQLNASLTTKDRDKSLGKTIGEIQKVSEDIRKLQISFNEQFKEREKELPKKWHLYGLTLGKYFEAAVEHTYVVDDLMENLEVTGFWNRLKNIRNTLKIFGRLDAVTKKCVERGDALNELIHSGKYSA